MPKKELHSSTIAVVCERLENPETDLGIFMMGMAAMYALLQKEGLAPEEEPEVSPDYGIYYTGKLRELFEEIKTRLTIHMTECPKCAQRTRMLNVALQLFDKVEEVRANKKKPN